MNTLKRLWVTSSFVAMSFAADTTNALAASFGGPIPAIPGTVNGNSTQGVRDAIVNALKVVLNFLALIAVVFVVVAGIRLIVSQGEDEAKDKAKKTILYVIIGLIVVLFARVIVGFFTTNPFNNAP